MIRSIVIPLILLLSANMVWADIPSRPLKPSESLSGRPLLFEEGMPTNHVASPDMKLSENERITHIVEVNKEVIDLVYEQMNNLFDLSTQAQIIDFASFTKNHPILEADIDIPTIGIFSNIQIKSVYRHKDLDKSKYSYHITIYLNNPKHEASISIYNGDLIFNLDGDDLIYQVIKYKNKYFFTQKPNIPFHSSPNDVVTNNLEEDKNFEASLVDINNLEKIPTDRNPIVYNVLFLYEEELSLSAATKSRDRALTKFINLLMATKNTQNVVPKSIGISKFSYPVCIEGKTPEEDIKCNKDTPYSVMLEKLKNDSSLLVRRRENDADLVVLLRSQKQPTNTTNVYTSGLAYRKRTSSSSEYTHGYAVALADPGAIAHELAHLAGAGHSLYNSVPGTGSAAAVVAEFNHTSSCSIPHKHGYYTFMAYPHVCDAKYEAEFPRACSIQYPGCFKINRFSEPDTVQVDIDTPEQVFIGTATQNNAANIALLSPSIVNYAESIPDNLEPKPVINKISGNNKVWQEQCFNAVGTTDPEDNLKHFDWQVYQGGSYKASKITKSLTEPFCYTPDAHRLYDVKMTAFDTGNLYKQTVYGLQAVTPAARITNLFSDLGKVYISYGVEGNIQPPANVIYKIFEMNKSSSKPIWDAGTQTSATTEDFYRPFNIGDTFAYKVRVCPSPFTCGPASAERQVKVELNNQTGQPVIPYRY